MIFHENYFEYGLISSFRKSFVQPKEYYYSRRDLVTIALGLVQR